MKNKKTLQNFLLLLVAFVVLALYLYTKVQSPRKEIIKNTVINQSTPVIKNTQINTTNGTVDAGIKSPVQSGQPSTGNQGLPAPIKNN